jgi:hypothetical protein
MPWARSQTPSESAAAIRPPMVTAHRGDWRVQSMPALRASSSTTASMRTDRHVPCMSSPRRLIVQRTGSAKPRWLSPCSSCTAPDPSRYSFSPIARWIVACRSSSGASSTAEDGIRTSIGRSGSVRGASGRSRESSSISSRWAGSQRSSSMRAAPTRPSRRTPAVSLVIW